MDVGQLVSDYGFPIVMSVGLGYFIYYVWWYIGEYIEPKLDEMHFALIRVIDQTRMLDQDLIRLQQKLDTVIELREQKYETNTRDTSASDDESGVGC